MDKVERIQKATLTCVEIMAAMEQIHEAAERIKIICKYANEAWKVKQKEQSD